MHGYLEGVTIDCRLWILLSNKGYSIAWYHWSPGGPYEKDASRIWQFGINTIIFALTQEASVTNRVMDSVGH